VASFIGEMNILPATITGETGMNLTIDLAAFGRMEIARNPNVSASGTSIIAGIRPEQLEIKADKPADYPASVQGTVQNVAFYGENIHYHVAVPGIDAPIAVSVPNYFHTVDFDRGDTVWLGLQGASVIDLGKDQ
jgi:spermidine/putrescine transport system ATP-binding protein